MPVFETSSFQSFNRIVVLAIVGCSMALVRPGIAQDELSLEQLQQQWSQLDAQFAAKEELMKNEGADAATLELEYRELVNQADALIAKIESKAMSNLKSKPNDSASLRALMGIMLNEAQLRRDAKVLKLGDELIAQGINPQYFEIAARSERLSIAAREIFDELIIRQQEAIENDLPRVKFSTTQGDIVVELFENEAPNTVGNFIHLVENGYYKDRIFHRVIEGFMAQSGGYKIDENGKEFGGEGPGYCIACECFTPDRRQHFSGSISMAHRGKDTGGGQFFLTFARISDLDSKFPPDPVAAAHTCFGRVVAGFDVLDSLARTHIDRSLSPKYIEEPIAGVKKDKILSAEVIRKRDHVYQPVKVVEESSPGAGSDQPEKSSTKLTAPESDEATGNDKQDASGGKQ